MNARQLDGVGAISLGVGIAAGAIGGPLVLSAITFRTSARVEQQFVGGEVVSLGVVAPALIVAGLLWLRRHPLGPVVALGPALYAIYTYTTVVVGQEYLRYPGNVERFFPLYTGLVALGALIALRAWSQLHPGEHPLLTPRLRRGLITLFSALGGFFALAWVGQIRLVWIDRPPAEYQDAPTLFWLIKFLDCGFVIPALLATASGLLVRAPWSIRASYLLAPFATCMAASIAGMAIAMQATGDPSAEPIMIALTLPVTIALGVVTWELMRVYPRSSSTAPTDDRERMPIASEPAPATRSRLSLLQ